MKRTQPKTLRFWAFVNGGPVRIKIKPGQTLEWTRLEITDEGFVRSGEIWESVTGRVTVFAWHEGRDCDGRVSGSTESYCHVDQLADGYKSPDESFNGQSISYPAWQHVETEQRDYAAEAAGY